MPATQSKREIAVKSALADDALLFRSMQGTEALGRLPEFTVNVMSEDHAIHIADVLGKPLTLALDTDEDGGKRYFHGIVTRFCCTGIDKRFACYQVTVHPALWLLKHASNCRIFQGKTVLEIVKAVCADGDVLVEIDASALSADYPKLDYCVQYRETDLDFVLRLLEGAGMYFYFTHAADKNVMVLADSPGAHLLIPGYKAVRFCPSQQAVPHSDQRVSTWSGGGTITSSKYVLNDFDFEKPALSLVSNANVAAPFSQQAFALYDYPGNYVKGDEGTALARANLEQVQGAAERIRTETDARGLHPGGYFGLVEHPFDEFNRQYLVTQASYDFTENAYTSGWDGEGLTVKCVIEAIGKERAFRPLPVMNRPVIHGPQTAIVVGKAGEEIWTDQYGRIKVQFHWDRLGKSDENSSCWVRVAQGWAGKRWGAFTVPRIGMEVVVSFLEGDPDRPLVTGCVYNGDTMPPYPLPANQTRSTFKSRSSKDGEGFNELRFEDKKDHEEVFMHAERDFNRVVKNNDTLKVGFETKDKGDQSIDIKNDQTLNVGNDQKLTVTHDQFENIDNNQTVKIKVDQKLDVGGDQTVAIDGAQKIHAGTTIVIEAGTSIELKVGGSSIKIEAAKITIKAPEIEIAADANAKVKAGAMMEVKSGAIMTIGGALVQIN